MAPHFYEKATVQAAMIAGVLGIVGAYLLHGQSGQKQVIENSPGSTQVGRDLNINIDSRRAIDKPTAHRLIANLRGTPPQRVAITTNSGDTEAQRLRQQLIGVFAEADWRDLSYGEANIVPGPIAGISIRARTPVPASFVVALQPLFELFDQHPNVVLDESVQPDTIEIFIGVK